MIRLTCSYNPINPALRQSALIFFIITLVTFSLLQTCAYAAPLKLAEGQSYPLAGHLEMLTDPPGKLKLADILEPASATRFTPISGNLSKSYTRDTVWLRFTMIRSASFPEDAWLRLGPPYLDYVTVYLQTGGNATDPTAYHEVRLGDHIPAFERPVLHPDFVTPVQLPLDTPVTVFIRVKTTSSLNLSGAIHTTPNIIRYNTTAMMLHGGYLGIALVIALINLIYFLRVRDRLFLYFSVYIFIMFWNHMGTEGIITLVWPSQAHRISDYLSGMALGALVLSFSPFAMRLFNTSRIPWAHRYFWFMAIVGVVTMISVPLGFYGSVAPLTLIGALGTIVVLFWLSFRSVKNGEPSGMLYLCAFGVSNIGYVVQFLRLLGVFPLAWWNTHAVQVASLINMVLMTLALTERLRAAEEKAVIAARDSEQHAVELAEDMTVELRNEQEKLKEALERQVRFVDMVSHEYRTPLAIIKANLDILRDRKTDTSTHATSVSYMQRAVARLVEVVETSFSVSRLAGSATAAHFERIETADFLSEVQDEAGGLWSEATLILPPNKKTLLFVLADRSQLKTAVFNLINNAVKYGGTSAPIHLTLDNDEQSVRMAVVDQGPGIAEDELEKVRLKFRRGNSTDSSGKGVGLYLVDRIVAEHGGRFELQHNNPHGVIATIILPCCS